MIPKIFGVKSSKNGWGGEMALDYPSAPDEADLIEARYGSIERVFALAAGASVINCQRMMREHGTLSLAKAAAETYVDDGAKAPTHRKVVISDEDRDSFDDDQAKLLREKYGVVI